MDTLAHSIDGALMIVIPAVLLNVPIEFSLLLIIIFAVLGGFIDLYGEYKAKYKNDNYNWYDRAHNGDLSKIFRWILPIGLHIWLDKFGHGAGERWYVGIWYEYFMPWRWRERMWIESIQWLLILIIFLFLLF